MTIADVGAGIEATAAFALRDRVTHRRSGRTYEVFGAGTRRGLAVIMIIADQQLIGQYAWNAGGPSYQPWGLGLYMCINLPAADFDLAQAAPVPVDATPPSAADEESGERAAPNAEASAPADSDPVQAPDASTEATPPTAGEEGKAPVKTPSTEIADKPPIGDIAAATEKPPT